MSTATPPMPSAEPTRPALSQAARVIDTFIAPSKTFEDVRRSASWWVPWLLATIVSFAFAVVVTQKIDMVRFTRQQIEQSKLAQRQMEQLSPEQQEQQIRIRATVTKYVFYVVPVFGILGGLVVGAALMAVFNFGFGAEVPFPQALAIAFYAFLPKTAYTILICVSLLLSGDPNSIDIAANPMPTNPGFFMDPQGNKFLYALASNLDLNALWCVCLLGLGFAVASSNRKLKPGTAIATMFAIYGILILIGAGFKAAF